MDPIRVYNLGDRGVNVDDSPIHTTDGDLAKAQNAVRDNLGIAQGIHKRPGLVKFNTNVAAGVVLGGIGVPLVLLQTSIGGVTLPGGGDISVSTGSTIVGPAPGEGGGDATGLGTGAGSGAGGGGSTGGTGGGSGSGGSGSGSLATHGRKVFYGRTSRAASGVGVSAGSYATLNPSAAGVVAADAVQANFLPSDTGSNLGINSTTIALDASPWCYLQGSPAKGAVLGNVLYWPSGAYTAGDLTTPLSLVSFDGSISQLGGFVQPIVIADGITVYPVKWMSVLAVSPFLYVAVATQVSGVGARGGIVYQINLYSGNVKQVGNSFLNSDGYIPYSLVWHLGKLWCGTIGRLGVAGRIYSIRPPTESDFVGDAAWVNERTMTKGTGVSTMCVYNGELYTACFNDTTQTIEKMDTLGAWTVDKSTSNPGPDSGHVLCSRVFETAPNVFKLFVAISYPTASSVTQQLRIWERDSAGTWTKRYDKVYNVGGNGGAGVAVGMFVENTVNKTLWVFGGDYTFNATEAFLLTSADGITWSDQSSKLTNGSTTAMMNNIGELVV